LLGKKEAGLCHCLSHPRNYGALCSRERID
jgi:hypothetical protein